MIWSWQLTGAAALPGAAENLLVLYGRRWAVTGHSQGGHAALVTASLAAALAPDLELIGAVAIAGPAALTT